MILSESTRAERIATLTALLLTRRELCASDLAEQLTTSSRNINRDLEEISRVLPIYYDDGRWYYVETIDSISPY